MKSILVQEVEYYLSKYSSPKDPLLEKMEIFALKNKIPILESSSAQFLEYLLYLNKPKRFLEIGTAIGYSTIRAAKILRNHSKIDTIELSDDNVKLAKSFFREAGLKSYINLIEANALDFLENTSNSYDFIFLDADKEDYPDYLGLVVDRLVTNGLLLVDNLLWKGYVLKEKVPEEYKKSTEFIKKFNAHFLKHPLLNSTILTIGDGLGLAIKLS